jgi:hypothetical protein
MPMFRRCLTTREWAPSMHHNQGGHTPMNLRIRATHRRYDLESYLGNLFLSWSLDGLEDT